MRHALNAVLPALAAFLFLLFQLPYTPRPAGLRGRSATFRVVHCRA